LGTANSDDGGAVVDSGGGGVGTAGAHPLSVDVFDVALYGANAPFAADRRQAIYAAIANRTSTDVMCVLDVGDLADRTEIAKAASGPGPFPYSYMATADQTTQPSGAADQRPTPTQPACHLAGELGASGTVTSLVACVDSNCSSAPGNENAGVLNASTSCLAQNCASTALQIFNDPVCYDCLLYELTSEQTLTATQNACTVSTQEPYAFGGQASSLILSHYPITNTATYFLPSTGFRRAVLKAQVQFPDSQTPVDVFCADLSSPLIDTALPYTGYYGSDKGSNLNGWEDEQDLQVTRAVSWIGSEVTADSVPAVILGNWHATAASSNLSPQAPEVMKALDMALTHADPPGYSASCDMCPSNPYYSASQPPHEYLTPYVKGFAAGSVRSHTLWGTDSNVSLKGDAYEPPPSNGMGPLSLFYPHNIQLVRP
jgi:hypothetical protein